MPSILIGASCQLQKVRLSCFFLIYTIYFQLVHAIIQIKIFKNVALPYILSQFSYTVRKGERGLHNLNPLLLVNIKAHVKTPSRPTFKIGSASIPSEPELMGSLKLVNFRVFVQMSHRPTRKKISCANTQTLPNLRLSTAGLKTDSLHSSNASSNSHGFKIQSKAQKAPRRSKKEHPPDLTGTALGE